MASVTLTTLRSSNTPLLTRLIADYLPRSLLPSLRASSSSSSSSAAQITLPSSTPAVPSPVESVLSGTWETIRDIWTGILLAVPKHKTTHSRKSMRSATKGLKNKTNISLCPACSAPKLSHHLCPNCYSQISRRWKDEARAGSGSGSGSDAGSARLA